MRDQEDYYIGEKPIEGNKLTAMLSSLVKGKWIVDTAEHGDIDKEVIADRKELSSVITLLFKHPATVFTSVLDISEAESTLTPLSYITNRATRESRAAIREKYINPLKIIHAKTILRDLDPKLFDGRRFIVYSTIVMGADGVLTLSMQTNGIQTIDGILSEPDNPYSPNGKVITEPDDLMSWRPMGVLVVELDQPDTDTVVLRRAYFRDNPEATTLPQFLKTITSMGGIKQRRIR